MFPSSPLYPGHLFQKMLVWPHASWWQAFFIWINESSIILNISVQLISSHPNSVWSFINQEKKKELDKGANSSFAPQGSGSIGVLWQRGSAGPLLLAKHLHSGLQERQDRLELQMLNLNQGTVLSNFQFEELLTLHAKVTGEIDLLERTVKY